MRQMRGADLGCRRSAAASRWLPHVDCAGQSDDLQSPPEPPQRGLTYSQHIAALTKHRQRRVALLELCTHVTPPPAAATAGRGRLQPLDDAPLKPQLLYLGFEPGRAVRESIRGDLLVPAGTRDRSDCTAAVTSQRGGAGFCGRRRQLGRAGGTPPSAAHQAPRAAGTVGSSHEAVHAAPHLVPEELRRGCCGAGRAGR